VAWLDVSQDPVVGDEQKKKYFWNKVHSRFVERMALAGTTDQQRAAGSLQTRWRALQATRNKFAGFYAAVVYRNESGKTIEDKILDADVLYREQNSAGFRSQAVWGVLRHSTKWYESLASKNSVRKRHIGNNSAETVPSAECEEDTEIDRPVGRKAVKTVVETERSLIAMKAELHKTPATDLDDIRVKLSAIWYSIPVATVQKVIYSIPAKLGAFRRATGGCTRW